MTFKRRHWSYKGEANVLAFNPRASMICLGESNNNETVWLTLFPLQALEPYPSIELMTADTGPTNMDPVVARITIAMLLFMMHRSNYGNVYLDSHYPDVSSEENFKADVGRILYVVCVHIQ